MQACARCNGTAMYGQLLVLTDGSCWHPPCLVTKLADLCGQVTQLQEHNTTEVGRRRKVEAKLELHERLGGLCIQALGRWGENSQLAMCAEECAELGAEILRVLRGRKDHEMSMMEEAADVFITVTQLRLLAPTLFDSKVREKLDRLEKLLEATHA